MAVGFSITLQHPSPHPTTVPLPGITGRRAETCRVHGGPEILASSGTHAPSPVLAAAGNSSHFMALDDVPWGVLQQMPSVPFLGCVCLREHPRQALPLRLVRVSVRLWGRDRCQCAARAARAACAARAARGAARKRGERASVHGVSGSGDRDRARRALARADVLVLSKT